LEPGGPGLEESNPSDNDGFAVPEDGEGDGAMLSPPPDVEEY